MAIDTNFMVFLIPAIIAMVATVLALPSKSRIEKDPSTAYRRGRRAIVNLAVALCLLLGLALAVYGTSYNAEELVAGVNMVTIGGISLLAMGAVLLGASMVIRRQVMEAGQGQDEAVLEVAAVGAAPAPAAPVGGAGENLPPRPVPPPPQRVPRDAPPRDQWEDGPPPPYYRPPPPRRPPPG